MQLPEILVPFTELQQKVVTVAMVAKGNRVLMIATQYVQAVAKVLKMEVQVVLLELLAQG